MANSVTARFNDNCKVHVAMSDDTTVTKAVIIDAEGNETDIGGGGESDFSTAEVTLINSNVAQTSYQMIFLTYDDENGIATKQFIVETEVVVKVPMYKNKATFGISIQNVDMEVLPTVTGGVTIGEGGSILIITGDGTFTAKSTDPS